jgi:hypothetical protein
MTDISLAVGVGLVCALLSALGTNLAYLFRSRWWSIGWGVGGGGGSVIPPARIVTTLLRMCG